MIVRVSERRMREGWNWGKYRVWNTKMLNYWDVLLKTAHKNRLPSCHILLIPSVGSPWPERTRCPAPLILTGWKATRDSGLMRMVLRRKEGWRGGRGLSDCWWYLSQGRKWSLGRGRGGDHHLCSSSRTGSMGGGGHYSKVVITLSIIAQRQTCFKHCFMTLTTVEQPPVCCLYCVPQAAWKRDESVIMLHKMMP